MKGGDLELGELLAAAEAAPPGESVDVVAHDLRKRFGAEAVSFLFVDLTGQRLVRLAATGDKAADPGEPIDLQGSVYDSVLQSQGQHVEPDGQDGRRVITPVTNRGDCIGVLEVSLQSADDTVLRQVRDAAHALAYIIVTDRRFTDLYHPRSAHHRDQPGGGDPAPAAPLGPLLRGGPVHFGRRTGPGRRPRWRHLRPHARPHEQMP